MTRVEKIRTLLRKAGIDPDSPTLRIREGSSGAHTVPEGSKCVFDELVDSVRVRAFLPPAPEVAQAPKPKPSTIESTAPKIDPKPDSFLSKLKSLGSKKPS